jgi:hypothetical protein
MGVWGQIRPKGFGLKVFSRIEKWLEHQDVGDVGARVV